jgi:RNA polymerase sigma-B factor
MNLGELIDRVEAQPGVPARERMGAGIEARIEVATADPGVLFSRWTQFHDERAREELVKRFLPLARSLAWRYIRSSESLDDLVQVASLGLVKAVDRFDPARGLAFSTYAVPTILGELKRYFRDSGWAVHVPRDSQELARKVKAAGQLLADQSGRSPTVGELAQYLSLSDEEILDGLETAQAYSATSLDAPRVNEELDGVSRIESMGEEDRGLALADAAVTVSTAIERLPKREREILQLRFMEDCTQAEIAQRIGVSQMTVCRLLRGSLQRLRELTADAFSRE